MIARLKPAWVIVGLFLAVGVVWAAMSDGEALAEARRRFGDRAATAVYRFAGSTKLTRCVGVSGGPQSVTNLGCSEGSNWDAAFAGIPVPPLNIDQSQVHVIAGHIGCITDTSKTTITQTPFGPSVGPNSYRDCEDRLYSALVEMRASNPQLVDAVLRSRAVWLLGK